MNKNINIKMLILAAACAGAVIAVSAGVILAGDYHKNAVCADCHTMHYSLDGGTDPVWQAGGPHNKLLIANSANGLCLACHGLAGTGGAGEAPDVIDDILGYPAGSVRAAGRLTSSGTPNPNGHDIGVAALTAPGGTWGTGTGMTCKDCHDPHGNDAYRNLQLRPGGVASDLLVASVQQVSLDPTSTQYDITNIRYTGSRYGLSRWCKGCHTNFHCNDTAGGAVCTDYNDSGGDADGDDGAVSTDQWLRHPTRDVTMGEACQNSHVDDGDGACTGANDGSWFAITGSYLAVVSETCDNACTPGSGSAIPGGAENTSDNEPFCGTCHKAHGSTHDSGLVWDDPTTAAREDGSTSTMIDLCQTCHKK